MIEEDGGYWERASKKDLDALVCTTNNVVKSNGALVMGRGIAAQFRETFPYLDLNWGAIVEGIQEGGNEDYNILIDGPRKWQHNTIYLVGLQTKRDWAQPSPIELVIESCKKLALLANIMTWSKVLMTKPGCGNGGLTWKEVRKNIKFLDDRFIIIDRELNV